MAFNRKLETATLDNAAKDYATHFLLPTRFHANRPTSGRDWVLGNLRNMRYKDEFEYLIPRMKDWMAQRTLSDFSGEALPDRTDDEHERNLAEWLAVDPDGNHIKGRRGKVEIGRRQMGVAPFEVETIESIRRRRDKGLPIHAPGRTDRETHLVMRSFTWPIFAGEEEERAAGNPNMDSLVLAYQHSMAEVTTISYELAAAMLDQLTIRLEEGSTAATIRGRTGAQPVDPDAAETGTLLFTLTCTDPATFGAAADQNPNARITAGTVTGDSSADATNTLTYCRAGATGTGADDHIDGNALTAAASFVFNTVSIVAGATVDLTSWTITLPQGQA